MARHREPFLDRHIARLIALLVALGCIAVLAWLHRADLLSAWSAPEGAADPFAQCFVERAADIDAMLDEGVIDQARAELFKSRAEAMCRAETEGQ